MIRMVLVWVHQVIHIISISTLSTAVRGAGDLAKGKGEKRSDNTGTLMNDDGGDKGCGWLYKLIITFI